MQNPLEVFQRFLDDTEADIMYITGVAGTGKTTCLAELLEYCDDEEISAITCAYTHKACGVLRSKLPSSADVSTLHSYLCKRPTINDKALHIGQVDGNAQGKTPDIKDIVFIDEFSMVGEKDYMSLVDLQYNDDGKLITKLVFIGDLNQLPPVKDVQTIMPHGDYWVKLTKIHRQADDNPLIDNLIELNSYINGSFPEALKEHDNLVRGIDIVSKYKELSNTSKVILAYTNATVQELNAQIEGKPFPELGDEVYSPTTRQLYKLERFVSKGNDFTKSEVNGIVQINGHLLELNSKWGSLETLLEMEGIDYFDLIDSDDNVSPRAVVFGHGAYQQYMQELIAAAVSTNKAIQSKYNQDPKEWSRANWSNPLAKARGAAWKKYLAFKESVLCVDFKHAMTVHKSQGSTYDIVLLDTQDIYKCANRDFTMYLKLLYVGISRAALKVYTN